MEITTGISRKPKGIVPNCDSQWPWIKMQRMDELLIEHKTKHSRALSLIQINKD